MGYIVDGMKFTEVNPNQERIDELKTLKERYQSVVELSVRLYTCIRRRFFPLKKIELVKPVRS